jgi:hypothetical protein
VRSLSGATSKRDEEPAIANRPRCFKKMPTGQKIKKSDAYIGNAANPNREAMNAEHAALR